LKRHFVKLLTDINM